MNDDALLLAVRDFADAVLALGGDTHGGTPLLADGLDLATKLPVAWRWCGQDRLLSNLANQQRLLRVLMGLSVLTGHPRYAEVALSATRHALRHCTDSAGLPYWGGHVAWDLRGRTPFGHAIGRPHHELKSHFPCYDLLWQADADAADRLVHSIWSAHVLDWSTLAMSRHGAYGRDAVAASLWEQHYLGGPVFFESQGLSFINAGSDLIYAAASHHQHSGAQAPLLWAKRLAQRYIDTRDPATGLGGYQFSRVQRDRAQAQFGPEWGPDALEGRILSRDVIVIRYAMTALSQLHLAFAMPRDGAFFGRWACDDLRNLARHVYHPQTNLLQPMWTHGTPLGRRNVKRQGYYNPALLDPWPADARFLWAFACAFAYDGDPLFWNTAAAIARGLNLLTLPEDPRQKPTLPDRVPHDDVRLIPALLAMHRATGWHGYLQLAGMVGTNILRRRRLGPWFINSPTQPAACFNEMEPLALLALVAAMRSHNDPIFTFPDSDPQFSAEHDTAPGRDAFGRTSQADLLYHHTILQR